MKISVALLLPLGMVASSMPLWVGKIFRREPALPSTEPTLGEKILAALAPLPGMTAAGTFGGGVLGGAGLAAGPSRLGVGLGRPGVGLRFPNTNPPGSAPHANGGGGLAGNGLPGGGSIRANIDAGGLGRTIAPGAGLKPRPA
ncbi:hypothetical protein CDD83_3545 [Cordyceps sp. RAO-2017]|nr:hypothetical protein CDD83_3545 [Cordyceps sp. RAO-2017]